MTEERPGPEFVAAHEFALVLGFNPRAFVRTCRRGRVPGARRIGSRWIVCIPEFRAHFCSRPAVTTAPAVSAEPRQERARVRPIAEATDADLDRLLSRAVSGVP